MHQKIFFVLNILKCNGQIDILWEWGCCGDGSDKKVKNEQGKKGMTE